MPALLLAKGYWRAPARMGAVVATRAWLRDRDLSDLADAVVRGRLPEEQLELAADRLAQALMSGMPAEAQDVARDWRALAIHFEAHRGQVVLLVHAPGLGVVPEGAEAPVLCLLSA